MKDVYESFRFRIELGRTVCGFNEVLLKDGDDLLIDAIAERTMDSFAEKGPGTVVLRRGLCPAQDLEAWYKKSEKGKPELRDVHVFQLDDKKKPAASWYFFNARPVHLDGPGAGGSDDRVVEQLILEYDEVHCRHVIR